MTVTGTLVLHNIEVDIGTEELIEALWKRVDMSSVGLDRRDYCWERQEDRLIEMEDISYHGSSCWKKTGKEITDPVKLKYYDLITELQQMFREEDRKKP